jgi:hypothetical protein
LYGYIGCILTQALQNPVEKVVIEAGILFPQPDGENRQKAAFQHLQDILLLQQAARHALF